MENLNSTAELAINAHQLALAYGAGDDAVVAVEGLNLTIKRNEFIAIIGPSGCGKSTLLRAVADLLPQGSVRGTLTVNGTSPSEARIHNAFAFVFQDPVLAPWRTVVENIALPMEVVHRADRKHRAKVANDLARLVGLNGFENSYPAQLSGGMKQRVQLARALTLWPSVLLMDEPLGALDEITRERMQDEVLKVWQSTQATVLLVTHSISEAVYMADRVVVLTRKPGQLKDIVDIPFDRPRRPELKRSVEFLEKANEVRAKLGM